MIRPSMFEPKYRLYITVVFIIVIKHLVLSSG